MNRTASTRERVADAPELDPAFDSRFDIELAESERDAALDGVPGPRRESGVYRYVRWQVRDFLRHRAVFLVPLVLVGVWIFAYNYDAAAVARELAASARGGGNPGPPRTEAMFFESVALGAGLLTGIFGSILSVAGLVSREREGGQQRFLFAKPVRITSYYLQAFAVNGAGVLAVAAFAQLAIAIVFGRAVPVAPVMLGAAASYMAVGGLAFLVSTLVRFDLAIAGLLTMVSIPLHAAAQEGRWWAVATSWLFPPIHQFRYFFDGPPGGGGLGAMLSAAGTMIAYGVAYVSAAVAVLKRRPIIR